MPAASVPTTLLLFLGLVLVNFSGCSDVSPARIDTPRPSQDFSAGPSPYVPASTRNASGALPEEAFKSADELSLITAPAISLPENSSPIPIEQERQLPKDPLQKARYHARKGEYKDAISHYREAIYKQPDDAVAHFELALALNAIGEPASATPILDTAIRLYPEYLEAYLERGNSLMRRGLTQPALADYEAAHKLAPDRPDILCAMANAKLGLRKFAEAEEVASQAIQVSPKYAVAYVIRGLSRAVQGKHKQAEADLASATANQASPKDLETLKQQLRISKSQSP